MPLRDAEIRTAVLASDNAAARSGWIAAGGTCWRPGRLPIGDTLPEATAAAEFERLVGRAMAGMLHDAIIAAKKKAAARVLAARATVARKQLALMGLREITHENVDLIQVVSKGAAHTGADPAMLLAIAWTESLFVTTSTTSLSSATGPFQFTTGGWITAVHDFGSRHGMDAWASKTDLLRDGSTVGHRLGARGIAEMNAARSDSWLSSLLAGENIRRDSARLRAFLGRLPNEADVYLTHVLGYGGAINFIRIVQTEPSLPTDVALDPLAASNNPSLFMKEGEFLSSGEAYVGIKGMMEARRKAFSEALEVGTDALLAATPLVPPPHLGGSRYMASNRGKQYPRAATLRLATAAR